MPLQTPAAAVVAALTVLLLMCQANAQPALRITGYGEATFGREVGIRDPGTVEGDTEPVRTVDGAQIVQQTSRIEARLCRRFGITFMLEGLETGGSLDITIQTRHPAITRPDGQVTTGVRYPSSVSAGRPNWIGYTFDYAYELVPGTWSFAVLHGGNVLAEQQFEVTVPPDADPHAPGRCAALVS
ncbi:MAG: DUF3859 domain-containing protein [Janthinobacterium lividum]